MLVKDILSTDVHTISPDVTCQEIIFLMDKQNANCLFVVDEGGKYLGMVTVTTLLRSIVPDYLKRDPELVKSLPDGALSDLMEQKKDQKVIDFMDQETPIVRKDMKLLEILVNSVFKGNYRLPVLDEDGVLIGTVNRRSIRQKILHFLGKK